MIRFLTVVILSLAVLQAKAQKKISGGLGRFTAAVYRNDEYKAHRYNKILVFSGTLDPAGDKRIIEHFRSAGLNVISSLELLPPSKDLSESQQQQIIETNGVDGIIRITETNIHTWGSNRSRRSDIKITFYDQVGRINALTIAGHETAGGRDYRNILVFVKKAMPEIQSAVRN